MLCRARKKLNHFHKCHNSFIHLIYSKEVASMLVGSDAKVSNWWIRMRIKISFKETPTDLHKRRKIKMWRIHCQVTATKKHYLFCFCARTYIWAFFLMLGSSFQMESYSHAVKMIRRGGQFSSFLFPLLLSSTSEHIQPRQVHPLSD